jgi:hypothetical protein
MIKLLNDLSMFTKPNMLKDMKMNLRKDTMQLREKVNRLRPMRPDFLLFGLTASNIVTHSKVDE